MYVNGLEKYKDILSGKKLLILSGDSKHVKLVKAAKELGIYTIVADYLSPDDSPAKKIADESWLLSYVDVKALVERCKNERVDGVLTCYQESTLVPYYWICKELQIPCYGEINQFEQLMNKKIFKALCQKNGLNVISEYSFDDVAKRNIEFPVFVKPTDSGGSKGQTICNNYDELEQAILYAQSESSSKDILIEKYIANKNSFQVTYFFANGVPYVIRTADGYKGRVEDNLDRVALCSVSPSAYTKSFMESANKCFADMLKDMGIKNGPVMAQGFYDNGVFRFYDPGRRFPGTDFEIVYKEVFGIDLMQMMVIYALTGTMPETNLKNENVLLAGKKAVLLFPVLQEGVIGEIHGYSELKLSSRISNIRQRYNPGDKINKPNTTLQRIFEVGFLGNSIEEIKEIVKWIQTIISVTDSNGQNMLCSPFDADRLT